MTDIHVTIGASNGDGRRHVTYQHGDKQYPDVLDLASGFQREASIKRALPVLGLSTDHVSLLDGQLAQLAAAKDEAADKNKIDYHPLTCAQLIATKMEIRYLVNNLVAAGQPLVIAGPQKTLKTSLALDLAFSLATAGHFLGYFQVPERVAVGVMSGESGLPTIAETLRRIARAAGQDPSSVQDLIVSDHVPQFGSLPHLDATAALIKEYALEVLIIDPAFMAMDGADAGNLFIQGQLLRRVSEVCQELNCTLVLCHHARKAAGATYEPLELASIAWSGFAEVARQWLLLNRREPYEPGSGLHRLHLSVGGSAGHGGYWGLDIDEGQYQPAVDRDWRVTVLNSSEVRGAEHDRSADESEAKQQARVEADRKRIIDAAAKFPDGETAGTLRTRCGMSGTRFTAAIAAALDEGSMTECELIKPNRRQPYQGYKLAERG